MSVPQDVQESVALIDGALPGLIESCTVPVFAVKWGCSLVSDATPIAA